MQARREALGLEVTLASAEQVDQALHEMAGLTLQQRTIEAASKARSQSEMAETQAKLVVVIEEQPVTIQDRWNRLKDAIFHWAAKGLKPALPRNRESLTLAHGVIKTRDLADAVEILEGKKDTDAAADRLFIQTRRLHRCPSDPPEVRSRSRPHSTEPQQVRSIQGRRLGGRASALRLTLAT